MAKTGSRPKAQKGWTRNCEACKTPFWVYPSRPNKSACSMACRDVIRRAKRYNDADKTKFCVNCETWKPFAEYSTATGERSGGLQAYCNLCAIKVNRAWAKANPEKRRASSAAAHKKAKESGRIRPRTDAEREQDNAWRREWGKANRHKTRIWNRLRVHRLRAAGEIPKWPEIEYLLCAQDARCPYCNALLGADFHIDHKVPVSKGGQNAIENLQLTCPICNMRKGVKSDDEFRAALFKIYHGWLPPTWQYVL